MKFICDETACDKEWDGVVWWTSTGPDVILCAACAEVHEYLEMTKWQ